MLGLPAPLQNLLTLETFYIIANILSIASFILSVIVLWNIRKLRNAYRLRGRGPSLIRELSKSASNLSNYLNDYTGSIRQIEEELKIVSVKLASLESKIGGRLRISVKQVRTYVDQSDAKAENENEIRRVYLELLKVTEELKDHQKDLDWEV